MASVIWTDSYLVGHTIRVNISFFFICYWYLAAFTRAGKAKANVFPEPVGAIPIKSLLSISNLRDLLWISVGDENYDSNWWKF